MGESFKDTQNVQNTPMRQPQRTKYVLKTFSTFKLYLKNVQDDVLKTPIFKTSAKTSIT